VWIQPRQQLRLLLKRTRAPSAACTAGKQLQRRALPVPLYHQINAAFRCQRPMAGVSAIYCIYWVLGPREGLEKPSPRTKASCRAVSAAAITYAIREATGRKFHPTQPPVGPVGSWDGLEVAQGVQLGHRATWFGGGRARPAPAPAPLPPPRRSGWRPAGKAVRLFGS
jgi:hypothetical protein